MFTIGRGGVIQPVCKRSASGSVFTDRMEMGGCLKVASGLVVSSLVLAGCGTTVEGTAAAPSSTPPRADTGNYPTTPQSFTRPGGERNVQADLDLLDAVVNPAEIDPVLNYANPDFGTAPTLDSDSISKILPPVVGRIVAPRYGTSVSRQNKPASGDRAAQIGVVQYAGVAETAAVAESIKKIRQSAAAQWDGLPGFPDAIATGATDQPGSKFPALTQWVVPYKSFLIFVTAGVPSGERQDLAGRIVAAQAKRLDSYSTTYAALELGVPTDRDGIMSLTMQPSSNPDRDRKDITSGYLTPYASLNKAHDWARFKAMYDKAGVDLVGSSQGSEGTTVYRTRDAAAASAMVTEVMVSAQLGANQVQVPDVPGAVCGGSDIRGHRVFTCAVANGRYVALSGIGLQRDAAFQQIAAQYAILGHGK